MTSQRNKIEGGLVGLLVGDALGVPYEFHPPAVIPEPSSIEYEPPDDFDRAHADVPPGTWSDDGAQALCLLASLLHCERLDENDLGNRLVDWYENGYMAVDHLVFDVGIQTGKALRRIRQGHAPQKAGPKGEWDNGNGSLMRVLPLALWHRGTDTALVSDAALQSVVTHGHRRSQLCCGLYCLWARRILEGHSEPWDDAARTLRRICEADSREIDEHIRPHQPPGGEGTGYVVDTLHSARLACDSSSYEGVVKSAIRLGNDTDTTAAVAGGIAGLRFGVDGIPRKYVARLRGEEIWRPLLAQLTEHLAV